MPSNTDYIKQQTAIILKELLGSQQSDSLIFFKQFLNNSSINRLKVHFIQIECQKVFIDYSSLNVYTKHVNNLKDINEEGKKALIKAYADMQRVRSWVIDSFNPLTYPKYSDPNEWEKIVRGYLSELFGHDYFTYDNLSPLLIKKLKKTQKFEKELEKNLDYSLERVKFDPIQDSINVFFPMLCEGSFKKRKNFKAQFKKHVLNALPGEQEIMEEHSKDIDEIIDKLTDAYFNKRKEIKTDTQLSNQITGMVLEPSFWKKLKTSIPPRYKENDPEIVKVQTILFAANEDFVQYALRELNKWDIASSNPKIKSFQFKTSGFKTAFKVPEASVDSNAFEEMFNSQLLSLLVLGGSNPAIDVTKLKRYPLLLEAMADQGLVDPKDNYSPVSEYAERITEVLDKAWINHHLDYFVQKIVKHVGIKKDKNDLHEKKVEKLIIAAATYLKKDLQLYNSDHLTAVLNVWYNKCIDDEASEIPVEKFDLGESLFNLLLGIGNNIEKPLTAVTVLNDLNQYFLNIKEGQQRLNDNYSKPDTKGYKQEDVKSTEEHGKFFHNLTTVIAKVPDGLKIAMQAAGDFFGFTTLFRGSVRTVDCYKDLSKTSKLLEKTQKEYNTVVEQETKNLSLLSKLKIQLKHLKMGYNKLVRKFLSFIALLLRTILKIGARILELTGVGALVGFSLEAVSLAIQGFEGLYRGARWIYKQIFHLQGKDRNEAATFFVTQAFDYKDSFCIDAFIELGIYKESDTMKDIFKRANKVRKTPLTPDEEAERFKALVYNPNSELSPRDKVSKELHPLFVEFLDSKPNMKWGSVLISGLGVLGINL